MATREWSLKENSRRLKVEEQEHIRLKNSEKQAKMIDVAKQKYMSSALVGEGDQGRKGTNSCIDAEQTPRLHVSSEAEKTLIIQGSSEAVKNPMTQGSSIAENNPLVEGSSEAEKKEKIQPQSQFQEPIVKSEDPSSIQKSLNKVEIKLVSPNITRRTKEGSYNRWAHVNNRDATKKKPSEIVESSKNDLLVIELNPQPQVNEWVIEACHKQREEEEKIQCLPKTHDKNKIEKGKKERTIEKLKSLDRQLTKNELKFEKGKEESTTEKLKSLDRQLTKNELKYDFFSSEKSLECEAEPLEVQRSEVQNTRTLNQSSPNKPVMQINRMVISKHVYPPKHTYFEDEGNSSDRYKDVMESYRHIKTKNTITENVPFSNLQHATPVYRQSHLTPKQIRAETFGEDVPVSWVHGVSHEITPYGNQMGSNQPKYNQDRSPGGHHVLGLEQERSSPPPARYVSSNGNKKEKESPKTGYITTGSVELKTITKPSITSKGKVVLSSNSGQIALSPNSRQIDERLDKARRKKFSYFLNSIVGPAFGHKVPAKLMNGRDFTTGKILPGLHRTDENPCRDQLAVFVDCFAEQSTLDPRYLIIAKNNLASCVSSNKDYFYSPGSSFLKKPPIMNSSVNVQEASNGNVCDDD